MEAEIKSMVKKHVPDQPAGKCRKAVDETIMSLSRRYDCEAIEGRFVGRNIPGGEGTAYHWYIRVNLELGDEIIVDPTVQQFVKENYYPNRDDGVNSFVPPEYIPDSNVITPDSDLYEAYSNM